MKGKISISRMCSNDINSDNLIHIKVEDDDYNRISDIYIKPSQFGLALTGLACQECEIEN